jgi:hypothetical protein
MPKQSESRIILPQRVAQGQAISAIWANQIREAIWRLTMRYGSDATGPTLPEYHPFVSLDEPNDIGTGTDGGALYVAPEEE